MSATATTDASPQEVLEYVLDLDQYRRHDSKILRVSAVEGPDADGRGSIKMWGKLPWMPPAPDIQNFELERWNRLTFSGAGRRPARLIFDFTGTFECAQAPGGATSVTHSYEFRFRGPFRLVERRLGPWLRTDVEREVTEVAAALGPLPSTGRQQPGPSPL